MLVALKKASDRQSPVRGEPDAQYAAIQVGASWGEDTAAYCIPSRLFAPKANISLVQRMGVSTKDYAAIEDKAICNAPPFTPLPTNSQYTYKCSPSNTDGYLANSQLLGPRGSLEVLSIFDPQ